MTYNNLTFTVGREEVVVRQRWETASILFFWESTSLAATWFFLVGSIQFLGRPVIRLRRRIHLRRLRGDRYTDDAQDY